MSDRGLDPWGGIIGRSASGGNAADGGPDNPYWNPGRGQELPHSVRHDEAVQRERITAARERADAMIAEQGRLHAAAAAIRAADDDFHAICVTVSIAPDEFDGEDLPSDLPDAGGDEREREAAPWIAAYHSMKMIRADGLRTCMMGGIPTAEDAATLYMVCRSEDADDTVQRLGRFASDAVTCRYEAINATRLYEAMAERGAVVGHYGGASTSDLAPQAEEDRVAWLDRVVLSAPVLNRLLERWEMSGGDPDLFDMIGGPGERSAGSEKLDFLGGIRLLARKMITSVVAHGGVGKTSFLQEIAAVLSGESIGRARSILGMEVTSRFVVAMVFAEDAEGRINQRAAKHSTICGPPNYFMINGRLHTFDVILERLERIPHLDLVILDPVRAYLDGNEDDAGAVSEFFGKLERLAELKNCAILVAHHFKKGRVRSLSEALDAVRGSGVHSQRVRLMMAMLPRKNGQIEIGIIKHNLDEDDLWAPLNQGVLFQRDAETSTLVPVSPARLEQDTPAADADSHGMVGAAIGDLNLRGIVVRRSGKAGLFELRLPELAGLSRAVILDGIHSLIDAGTLVDGVQGLQIVTTPQDSSEPA